MKLKELKHNHSLTDLLKVLIFSILMITPLLSVATRCLYVICNKNAYQSAEITQTTYSRTPKYEQGDINNGLEVDKIYHFSLNETSPQDIFNTYEEDNFINFTIVNGLLNINSFGTAYIDGTYGEEDYNNISYMFVDNDEMYIYIGEGYEVDIGFSGNILSGEIDIYIEEFSNIEELNISYFSNTTFQDYIYNEIESTTLDNVFEYSVNKLAESPILSWTQQTAIYTGVSTMTTQLGVNTPTIPMLIVYWFLLTVIYIIIDIIIKLFTWLTHMIGSKSV